MANVTYNDHTEATAMLSADKIPFWKAASAAVRNISWQNLQASDWDEQTPGTPSTGKWKLFFQADGLHIKDDNGFDFGPLTPFSGWLEIIENWSYASATTITVPSDATIKYRKGDKVRLKQGGGYKYFVVVGVAATTLTVFGGSDYSVANSTITDISISRKENPFGFPPYFNFSVAWTNFTLGNGVKVARISTNGELVHGQVGVELGSTSSMGTAPSFAPPITGLTIGAITAADYHPVGGAGLIDTGSALYMGEVIMFSGASFSIRYINTSGAAAVWSNITASLPFTWAAGDGIALDFQYRMA